MQEDEQQAIFHVKLIELQTGEKMLSLPERKGRLR